MIRMNKGLLFTVFFAGLVLFVGMIALPFGAQSADYNEGTILFSPHPDEELTQTGYPIDALKPGKNTTFRFMLHNDHTEDQRVFISISGPEYWKTSVPGIADVPAGDNITLSVRVEVPDIYPTETLDPTQDYTLRMEGEANITGDLAYTLMVVDLRSNIEHDLKIIPENVEEYSYPVYPGDKKYFDIMLTNTGEMRDRYVLSIETSASAWDIEFRDGGKETYVSVRHGEFDNRFVTQVLLGVPRGATPGEEHTFTITSMSNASAMFGTGLSEKSISFTFVVNEPSSVSIIPLQGYMEAGAGEELNIDFKIVHAGNEPSTLRTELLFSREGAPTDPWELSESFPETILMDLGESRIITVRPFVPEDAFGLFEMEFGAEADNTNVNTGKVTIDVEPRKNVTIDSVTGGPFLMGEDIEMEVTVSNNGYDTQRSYMKLEGLPVGYQYEIVENPITLPAKEERVVHVTISPSESPILQGFRVNIMAMLAVEGSGWERASSRNFNIEYLESPELNITRLVVPENPMLEGKNVTIEVTVHNEGNGVVSGASLTLYEITFGLSNKLIREMIMDLDPGEKITLSVNWTADVAAKSIRATVGCPGGVSEMDLSNNDLTRPVYVNPVEKNISDEGKHSGFLGSVPGEVAFVAVAGSLAIAGALTVVISSDVFRYGFFSLAIPLYSKLKPEHLLSNRLRRRIYVYVQNHPGEHFRSILLNLNLTNGTLAHHLYTLERESLIRSRRDGLYRRFYPAGYKIDENNLNISPIQRSILDLIDERPGLSQKDISRELDVSSSTVNYNIKSLKSRHMLKVVRDGKMTRIFREKDRNC